MKRTWTDLLVWLSWHALASVTLLLLPFLVTDSSFGSLLRVELYNLAILLVAFLASAAIPGIMLIAGRQVSVFFVLAISSTAFCLALLVLLLMNTSIAGSVIVVFVLLAFAVILFPVVVSGIWKIAGIVLLGVVMATSIALTDFSSLLQRAFSSQRIVEKLINTQFYDLKIRYFRGYIPQPTRGGAITALSEGYLVASPDGKIYELRWADDKQQLIVKHSSLRVPVNIETFTANSPPEVDRTKFRVADILIDGRGGKNVLLASHHYWYKDRGCFVLRVSTIDITGELPLEAVSGGEWKTFFETTPCLPLKDAGHPLAGHEAGGRITTYGDQQLLLTVGDHGFDGQTVPRQLSQDPDNSYGKTIVLNSGDGLSKIFSIGHRNPQGLYVDSANRIWVTEHGPQGGDELNIVVQGTNYGWPAVTLGSNYGSRSWPQNPVQGRHDGFARPVYAWIPSLGISNLIGVNSDQFPLWNGDLLIGSMKANKLIRTRITDNRVLFTEDIDVETRVRDLIQDADGRIVIWTDNSEIVTIDKEQGNARASAFSVHCTGCHEIGNGSSHGIGPDLKGVFGAFASPENGFEYSNALQNSGLRWDRETLRAFLQDPQSTVPGTSMVFPGISDPDIRANIIDFLEQDPN